MGKEKSPSFKNMAITGCQIMYSNSLWSQVKWLDIKLKWPISTPGSNHLPYLPATVEKACSKDSRLIDLVESCTWDIPNPATAIEKVACNPHRCFMGPNGALNHTEFKWA